MNQDSTKKSKQPESGIAGIQEVKTKLVRDYVESQRASNNKKKQGNGSAGAAEGVLLFSVLDDQKLFGSGAIAMEFETRKVDPYCWYKQQLASAGQAVDHRKISESA